jgi:hypothetical protein
MKIPYGRIIHAAVAVECFIMDLDELIWRLMQLGAPKVAA